MESDLSKPPEEGLLYKERIFFQQIISDTPLLNKQEVTKVLLPCEKWLTLRKHAYSNIQKISPSKTENF